MSGVSVLATMNDWRANSWLSFHSQWRIRISLFCQITPLIAEIWLPVRRDYFPVKSLLPGENRVRPVRNRLRRAPVFYGVETVCGSLDGSFEKRQSFCCIGTQKFWRSISKKSRYRTRRRSSFCRRSSARFRSAATARFLACSRSA